MITVSNSGVVSSEAAARLRLYQHILKHSAKAID